MVFVIENEKKITEIGEGLVTLRKDYEIQMALQGDLHRDLFLEQSTFFLFYPFFLSVPIFPINLVRLHAFHISSLSSFISLKISSNIIKSSLIMKVDIKIQIRI